MIHYLSAGLHIWSNNVACPGLQTHHIPQTRTTHTPAQTDLKDFLIMFQKFKAFQILLNNIEKILNLTTAKLWIFDTFCTKHLLEHTGHFLLIQIFCENENLWINIYLNLSNTMLAEIETTNLSESIRKSFKILVTTTIDGSLYKWCLFLKGISHRTIYNRFLVLIFFLYLK